MIQAQLYFADTLIKTIMINNTRPPFTIREMARQPMQVLGRIEWEEISSQPITMSVWIYSLKTQTGPHSYRYDLDGQESDVKFARAEVTTWDVGFNRDAEPTKEVNLNILAKKCKKRPRVKKLLLAFLRNP